MLIHMLALAFLAASDIDPDEQVVFFPSIGKWTENGAAAEVLISGWVFEPEHRIDPLDSFIRHSGLDEVLKNDPQADRTLLLARAAAFLVDNERGQRIEVRVGERVLTCEPSTPDGRFEGRFTLPREALGPRADPRAATTIEFGAVLRAGDQRRFEGRIHVLPPTGVSVISDVDDTIRDSQVRDKLELLRRTFLLRWQAVPGMADEYVRWSDAEKAAFHYVSAAPTPLIGSLTYFLDRDGFRPGSIHLRPFRLKEEPIFALEKAQEEHKRGVIGQILAFYPQRSFVLVGDSGERDPEIYGDLARAAPQQIIRISIRDVTSEPADAPRYRAAFRGIPPERWQIFKNSERPSLRP